MNIFTAVDVSKLFQEFHSFDEKNIRKKWKQDKRAIFDELLTAVEAIEPFDNDHIKAGVEGFIAAKELKFGDILPILRIGLTGTMKGPAIFEMMELFGKEEVLKRLKNAYQKFDTYIASLAQS